MTRDVIHTSLCHTLQCSGPFILMTFTPFWGPSKVRALVPRSCNEEVELGLAQEAHTTAKPLTTHSTSQEGKGTCSPLSLFTGLCPEENSVICKLWLHGRLVGLNPWFSARENSGPLGDLGHCLEAFSVIETGGQGRGAVLLASSVCGQGSC